MPTEPAFVDAARSPQVAAALRALGNDDGHLRIDGVDATALVERFGAPLYAFSAGVLRQRLASVQAALGPRVTVLFALKANPNAAVAAVLRAGGAGAEVASAGEIAIAMHAGFDGAAVQFAGPGKNAADLAYARHAGVGCLNLESEAEYEAVLADARQHGTRPGVALRVNPRAAVAGARLQMGGGAKKFGVDADDVGALLQRIHHDGVCTLHGLHVYAGTQCFDAAAWADAAAALITAANELEQATGVDLPALNFGGGFAVPVFATDNPFDLDAAGARLRAAIAADRDSRRYAVELGRYLVAPAGVYLTRVLYCKESGGARYAIVDGGMHHHAAAAGIGAVVPRPFPVWAARPDGTPLTGGDGPPTTIAGPLCTPIDTFATTSLPLRAGDLVAVLVSGAYGLTFSNTMFLSHPTPAEVLVADGDAHVVRAAGRPEDALRNQHLPPEDAAGAER